MAKKLLEQIVDDAVNEIQFSTGKVGTLEINGTTAASVAAFKAALVSRLAAAGGEGGGVGSVEGSPNEITGFWSGSQAQYDAIVTPDETVIYFVTA